MNKLISKLALALLASGFLVSAASAQVRIATIDLGKVFDGYWKTKQAQTMLNERKADMQKEFKNMIEDQKKGKEEYDKLVEAANDPALSADEKEKRKSSAADKLKYLRDQQETMAQFERQSQVTLEEQSRRMRENILGEIRNIVNAKAKAGGYTMVVDSAAESLARTPIIMYTNGELDITKDVLKELNATAPIDTTPAASDSLKTNP